MAKPTKTSFSTDAYESIKHLIVESKILPGEVITEQALAAQLEIGRTPIREALMRLEQEGLIITENRRKRVYALNVEEVNQIYELKICIESYMCALAAERATAAELKAIDRIMRQMEQHATTISREEKWFQKWMELDTQLHESIYLAANNPKSIEIIRGLNIKIHRFKLGLLTLKGRIEISVAEHRHFVDAILRRDSKAAEASMREHLQNVHQELVKLMNIFTIQ